LLRRLIGLLAPAKQDPVGLREATVRAENLARDVHALRARLDRLDRRTMVSDRARNRLRYGPGGLERDGDRELTSTTRSRRS
jgi:hypothetical protein